MVTAGAAALALTTVGEAVAGPAVQFLPGTYYLAYSTGDAPVDTVTVSLSGGYADFTMTGDDSETWSISNASIPDFSYDYEGVGYFAYAIQSASWNTTDDPYITFWVSHDGGGLTIGPDEGDPGANFDLVDLFTSSSGPGQVFDVPEPAAWTIMIVGIGLTGGVLRRRRAMAARRA
jgi:hypothetical protein